MLLESESSHLTPLGHMLELPTTVWWQHISTDRRDAGCSWAPPVRQNYVGTVVVVRDVKKDLTSKQMEAICNFCQGQMGGSFESAGWRNV